jgi:hypothetical protein
MSWLGKLRPRRPKPKLRYYVYVSDTKVDMLYAQIPSGARERLAAELKVDLKVLALSLSERPDQETRYSKVRLVSDYLVANAPVGTVDEPAEYFSGSMPMRWGNLGEAGSDLVYFGGSQRNTVVGLGGSMRHVIGATGSSSSAGSSLTYGLAAALRGEVLREEGELDEDESHDERWFTAHTSMIVMGMTSAVRRMGGPEERLEFLARRLLFDETEEAPTRMLLGTPIYVALADAPAVTGGARGTRAGRSA